MTATRRIRKKMKKGFSLILYAALIFMILPLACNGQNNYNLKSDHKTTESGAKKANTVGKTLPQAQRHEYVPDEVLVQFDPDIDPKTIARIQTELGLETAREFRSPNLFLMKITDGSSVEAIIEKSKAYKEIKFAEPNYVVKANQ